jgi:hypothetical protein
VKIQDFKEGRNEFGFSEVVRGGEAEVSDCKIMKEEYPKEKAVMRAVEGVWGTCFPKK